MTPLEFFSVLAPKFIHLFISGRRLKFSIYRIIPEDVASGGPLFSSNDPLLTNPKFPEIRIQFEEAEMQRICAKVSQFAKTLSAIGGFGGASKEWFSCMDFEDPPQDSILAFMPEEDREFADWRLYYERALIAATRLWQSYHAGELADGVLGKALLDITGEIWCAETTFDAWNIGLPYLGPAGVRMMDHLMDAEKFKTLKHLLNHITRCYADPEDFFPGGSLNRVRMDHAKFAVVFESLPPCPLGNTQEFHMLAKLVEQEGASVSHADLLKAVGRCASVDPRLDHIKHRLMTKLITNGYEKLALCIYREKGHYGLFLDGKPRKDAP